MEKFLAEEKVLKTVVTPQSNTGALTGARVKAVNAKRIAFVVDVGAGTSTTAHQFVLKQHDAESAGNSYDLVVENPYYHKVGAATNFTKVEVNVGMATFDTHAVLAQNAGTVVIEVLSEQIRPDCKWVSLNLAAAGGTQVAHVLAVVEHSFAPAYIQEV